MPASAFISYCRDDSDFALRLAQDLRAAGAGVWIDQLDIPPGDTWDDAIETALEAATYMLLVLSPASAKSKNVRNEIAYALDRGKIIIPVVYQDCIVPLQLQRNNRIDFRADYARGLAALLAHLQVDQPNQAVLDKAAEADAQRHAAWKAREAEAQRLKDLAEQEHESQQDVEALGHKQAEQKSHDAQVQERVKLARTTKTQAPLAPPTSDDKAPHERSAKARIILGLAFVAVIAICAYLLLRTKPSNPGVDNNIAASKAQPTAAESTPVVSAAQPKATPTAETPPSSTGPKQANTPPKKTLASPVPPPKPSGVLHIGGSVLPPTVISSVEPVFSEAARKAKISGDVQVYLWVDEQGHPTHVKVKRGVGLGLDEEAVKAVSQYKFKPATQNGKPVTVDLYIDVNFTVF